MVPVKHINPRFSQVPSGMQVIVGSFAVGAGVNPSLHSYVAIDPTGYVFASSRSAFTSISLPPGGGSGGFPQSV